MSDVRYSSRLTPSPLLLLVVAILGGSFGFIFIPISHALAAIIAVVGIALACAIVLASSPRVTVDETELRAGPAHIPLSFLRDPVALDAAGLRRAMGPEADLSAWVLHRPWARAAVKVRLEDDRDPTPYWLICVKDPHRLVQVLSDGGVAAS